MPLHSTLSFYSLNLLVSCSSVSAITAKSSAYSSSHGRATLNSLDMASMTVTNNSGLNAEPWCIPTFTSKPLLLPVFGYRSAWISNCWTALLTVRKIASVILLMCALLSIVYNLWNQLNVVKAIKNKRYFVDETLDMHWTFFFVIIGFCAFLQSYFQQCIHLVFSLFQLRSLYCVNFFYCPYFTSMNCSLMINYDGCLIQLCLCIFDQGLLFSNL